MSQSWSPFHIFFCMCVLSLKISTAAPPCVFRLQTYVAQVKEFSCGASHAKTKSIWWSEPRKTPSKKLENAHTIQEWLLKFQTSIMIVSSRRSDGLFLVPQLFKVFPFNLFFERAAKAWAPGSVDVTIALQTSFFLASLSEPVFAAFTLLNLTKTMASSPRLI